MSVKLPKSRLLKRQAPGEIRRFITGPWSQVMAAAHLADTCGAVDPGGLTVSISQGIVSRIRSAVLPITTRFSALRETAPMTTISARHSAAMRGRYSAAMPTSTCRFASSSS